MKKFINIMSRYSFRPIRFLLALLIVAFAGGCSQEDVLGGSDFFGTGEESEVRFTIKTPSISRPATLSRVSTPDENLISNITVFAIEDGAFAYKAAAYSFSQISENATSFSVRLKTTSSSLKLLFVANAEEVITGSAFSPGENVESIRRKLVEHVGSAGVTAPFAMYGDMTLADGLKPDPAQTFPVVKMLRNIARVDVVVSPEIAPEDFELVSVQAFRVSSMAAVIPESINNGSVNQPTIPVGNVNNINTSPLYVSAGTNSSVSQLYLPEAAAVPVSHQMENPTVVVVGGRYKGGEITFYRIDFSATSAVTVGQILRNHRYLFNIKKVEAPGWDDPDTAARNKSWNIIAEVQDWDENSTDMIFDGDHHFAVSSRRVLVRHNVNSQVIVHVNTDLDDYTLQWADEDGNPLSSSVAGNSISDDLFSVVKNAAGTQISVTALTTNDSGDLLTRYMVINAGRWKIKVTIDQSYLSGYEDISVNVLTVYEVGHLGNNTTTITAAGATGLRGILDAHFNPAGTVRIKGFNYFLSAKDAINNVLLPARLEAYDIIYLTNDNRPTAQTSKYLLDWLEAKPWRVLIVGADWTNTNAPLRELLAETTWVFDGASAKFNFVAEDDNTRPFMNGRFGPVSTSSYFDRLDTAWGRATSYSADVLPLVTSSNDGGMVVGVNKTRRVIYWGDASMLEARPGNYINNSTGNINNDQSRFVANMWAWIVESVVLPGKVGSN